MRTPFLIVSLSLLTVAVAAGQETQTERSAAASVISRMNALEGSLGLDQLVARLTAFAYLRRLGATNVNAESGRPLPYEETGTVTTRIAGVGVTAHRSSGGYHTFEMETDALGEVGHRAFTIDAQAMAGVLYAYATDARYRATVTREFTGLQGLYADYLAALRTAYPLPTVPDATDR